MEEEVERRTNERLQYSLKSQSHQLQSQSHQLQSQLTQSSMIGSPNVIHNMEARLPSCHSTTPTGLASRFAPTRC